MRMTTLAWLGALMLTMNGCANADAIKAAEEAAAEDFTEAAFVVADGEAVPQRVYVEPGKTARIWIMLAGSEAGEITPPEGDAKPIEPNQPDYVDLTDLTAGEHTLRITIGEQTQEAVVVAGERPEGETAEAAVLMARKVFMPIRTRVPAQTPLILHLYSTVGMPHGDFQLFGTDIALRFERKALNSLELTKGLQAGDYLISRPGYPNQNHGIEAHIIAE